MLEHVGQLVLLGPEIERYEDGSQLGHRIVCFHVLIAVNLQDGHPIAFLYTQSRQGICQPV